MTVIRRPAVAGAFYPDAPEVLAADVRRYLDQAPSSLGPVPKAIIAPHAGYVYSGPVAASAYRRLLPARGIIKRVILLGPCHRVPVRGLAASGADAFATPLGNVPLDRKTIDRLVLAHPQVAVFDPTHQLEHSLEVHLPFLQVVLGSFWLVPLVVGDASPDQVADVLESVWGGPETLIVVSSDLSHYEDYATAQRMDRNACRAIETLSPADIANDQACGRVPVKGLLTLAKRRCMAVATVDLRNSGDTAGTKDRVVGYGSWVFTLPEERPAEAPAPARADADADGEAGGFAAATRRILREHGKRLLHLAAASIEYALRNGGRMKIDPADFPADLRADGACFVTLKRNGQLRGCIGSVVAHRPLAQDVVENAHQAAFRDPRFAPLAAPEVEGLQLSISVLSPHWPIACKDENDLLAQLRPGVDGLIIEDAGRRALFLPSVWRDLPDKRQFLGHLKRKAGLPTGHWSATFRAERFIAEEIHARDVGDPAELWTLGKASN